MTQLLIKQFWQDFFRRTIADRYNARLARFRLNYPEFQSFNSSQKRIQLRCFYSITSVARFKCGCINWKILI